VSEGRNLLQEGLASWYLDLERRLLPLRKIAMPFRVNEGSLGGGVVHPEEGWGESLARKQQTLKARQNSIILSNTIMLLKCGQSRNRHEIRKKRNTDQRSTHKKPPWEFRGAAERFADAEVEIWEGAIVAPGMTI